MHVVCALYVPGVAFGDIDKLRPVTLTEMNYTKYGAKVSSGRSSHGDILTFPTMNPGVDKSTEKLYLIESIDNVLLG